MKAPTAPSPIVRRCVCRKKRRAATASRWCPGCHELMEVYVQLSFIRESNRFITLHLCRKCARTIADCIGPRTLPRAPKRGTLEG